MTCPSICFRENTGAPILQALGSWLYSPTRIAITKSILQRGNTCRGMLRACPGAVILSWNVRAHTFSHTQTSSYTARKKACLPPWRQTYPTFFHFFANFDVRFELAFWLSHTWNCACVCVCVRASLFCFSLTSAHLRELFWNSWALSKQRWPNVRDGGEVDQGVHECVCACVCLWFFK